MLQRIREACAGGEFRLDNIVKIDEAYIGGREVNKHSDKKLRAGRGTVGKVPVMGARERGGATIATQVKDADGETAKEFAKAVVEAGATIQTDGSRIYNKLSHKRETVCHSAGEYVRGDVYTNSIESVWAVLKRSITGAWHHVSPKHLHRYVNEAAMRLNGGDVKIDTIDRMNTLVRAAGGKRIRYRDLVSG